MKYLNEDGLQVVADKVKTRLKTVTEMPLTANNGAVRLYVGGTTSTYTKGHIYKYDSSSIYHGFSWTETEADPPFTYHIYLKDIEVEATIYSGENAELITDPTDLGTYLDSEMSVTTILPNGNIEVTSTSGGLTVVFTRHSEWDIGTPWTDITASGETADLNFDPTSENAQSGIAVSQALKQFVSENTELVWENKTWQGLTNFDSKNIWTDGTNIYYSYTSSQYVLDKSTSTWGPKTWQGLTEFDGEYIWTDGDNIYHSSGSDQYVLNKATSTWESKTWQGLTEFSGNYVWTDGTDIYLSNSDWEDNYVLNKSTSTWEYKTWEGLTHFDTQYIWTDGINYYYSNSSSQYVLNKATSTWEEKTWYGYSDIYGRDIWTDGINVYNSTYDGQQHNFVLNKATSTWEEKTWSDLTRLDGEYIWTDETNIYYSFYSQQNILIRSTK